MSKNSAINIKWSMVHGQWFLSLALSLIIWHLSFGSVAAQESDPTLLTVNGIPVSKSEFLYSYHRNCETDGELLPVNDFLEHFIDYKLKLAAALDQYPSALPQRSTGTSGSANAQVGEAPSLKEEAEEAYRQACKAAGNRDLIYPAQILLRVDTRATSAQVAKVKLRMDSICRALQGGADFAALASRLSDDETAACGGEMGWIGPNQVLEEVERVAFALQKGETSEPFLTPAGWHVIRLLDRQPATSDAVHRWYLTPRATHPTPYSADVADLFLACEYQEGLLVSQITQQTIYDKAAPAEDDLKRYFKKNRKRYGKKLKKRDFPLVRDLVLADYQQLQEQKWVVDLRRQYKVKVNKSVLRTIE